MGGNLSSGPLKHRLLLVLRGAKRGLKGRWAAAFGCVLDALAPMHCAERLRGGGALPADGAGWKETSTSGHWVLTLLASCRSDPLVSHSG